MNKIFDLCVQLLTVAAQHLNMTYKELNVWVFVIIEPIVAVLALGYIIYLSLKVRRLKMGNL